MSQDLLEQPVVDFLADAPVIDFLSDSVPENTSGVFCDPLKGGCGHFLTCHSRGMVIHDKCLILGCGCKIAKR